MVYNPKVLFVLVLIILICGMNAYSDGIFRVGAARRDITPPVGYEIQHFFRKSIGVHDSLFARCLYLADKKKNSVVIICLDLISGGYYVCDQLRETIKKKLGIKDVLINFAHPHSSVALGPRGYTRISNDINSQWNNRTLDAILAMVKEAKERAEPVSFRVGRAEVQVGFNRRLVDPKSGYVYMMPNREGPVVPWVNVLVADSKKTKQPIAVLYEHPAHPVIVPHTSQLTSADFPGAAAKRIHKVLGDDVIALFGQGCAGNINAFPLRSSHEKADEAGTKLGDAVLEAIKNSQRIKSRTFSVKFIQTELPSAPLPSEELWEKMVEQNKADPNRMRVLNKIRGFLDRKQSPPPRRFDAYAVMFGREWCLTTMPHEMFCQYELWIDEHAPTKHTMTFAYTNGYDGYIAVDEALRMGPKGGYEAASLPDWGGQIREPFLGPPAVGCEKIIQDALKSLWSQRRRR